MDRLTRTTNVTNLAKVLITPIMTNEGGLEKIISPRAKAREQLRSFRFYM